MPLFPLPPDLFELLLTRHCSSLHVVYQVQADHVHSGHTSINFRLL